VVNPGPFAQALRERARDDLARFAPGEVAFAGRRAAVVALAELFNAPRRP
jgi:hypothetical protein